MRLPKYRLHKPSGRAVVESVKLFGAGRRVYLPGAFGSPESQAAYAEICEKIARGASGQKPLAARRRRDSVTIDELCDMHLEWALRRYGDMPGSEFIHLRDVWRIAHRKFGKTRCRDFGPLAFKSLRAVMVERGWSRQHINHQCNRLRRIFQWGVGEELVDASVLAALREVPGLLAGETSAPEAPKIEPVASLYVAAVLPFMLPVIRAMVLVQYFTGMRSGEITTMQGEHLERLSGVWTYRPPKHKNTWRGMSRAVCLGPNAIEALAPYDAPSGYLFSPRIALVEQKAQRAKNRRTKLYGTPRRSTRAVSERYDSRSYLHAIRYAFDRARAVGFVVPNWHPHQLRHSRSTLVRARFGIEGAQASLGNTMEATEIYAERSHELAERIARQLG